MAGQGRLVKNLVRYGVRYGPVAFEAIKHGREPAQQAMQTALANRTARRKAVEHARTVREGSLLKVMHEGRVVWFVFSDDHIVTTYPPVPVPTYGDLLRHADLDKREKPPAPRKLPGKTKPPTLTLRRKRQG
jgi:hypothetical protein